MRHNFARAGLVYVWGSAALDRAGRRRRWLGVGYQIPRGESVVLLGSGPSCPGLCPAFSFGVVTRLFFGVHWLFLLPIRSSSIFQHVLCALAALMLDRDYPRGYEAGGRTLDGCTVHCKLG